MAVEAPTETPHVFTPEQIANVLAKLRKDPDLVRIMISSAQGGNEEDLRFMLESGAGGYWTDVEKGGSYVT